MSQEILKTRLERALHFTLNQNQFRDLARLFHEIRCRDKISAAEIIRGLEQDKQIAKAGGKGKFTLVKQRLIALRFPLTVRNETIDSKTVFLAGLKKPLFGAAASSGKFIPEKIFVEKSAKNSYLAKRFSECFPNVETAELEYCREYAQKNKFDLKDLKKRLVFIVREHWDFVKPCPCTKNHLRCNYWIFNLGFGCPYDCSYCFLQQYANFPGITLPANLDDFFNRFEGFYKKINRPIRIGTGEFCDSLALDHITGYSQKLIDFFRDKPVCFELKTKSDNTGLLLETKAAENIVISWSLNPRPLIEHEEIGVSSLERRIAAAEKIRRHGYSLAFHFDPLVYSHNWQKSYGQIIGRLYQNLKPGFKWISLGTLRGTRELKTIAEQRFPQSTLWYGELFLGPDKKLRYPRFLRRQMYEYLRGRIRIHDADTPLYLCMEDKEMWQAAVGGLDTAEKIEKYLTGQKYP